MKRTPEPELMNEPSQVLAYANAAFEVPHEAFCEEAKRVFSPDFSGRVLDLGCGPADVTVRFAKHYPHTNIMGIDGAPNMLAFGRKRVADAGLTKRIDLMEYYLPASLPPPHFDGAISNSLLHHLTDPSTLWSTIGENIKRGAPVFVMDLLRPNNEIQLNQLVAQYAMNEPKVLREDFRCSLHAAYRIEEVNKQLQSAGLAHLTCEQTSDRHFIVYGCR